MADEQFRQSSTENHNQGTTVNIGLITLDYFAGHKQFPQWGKQAYHRIHTL